MKRAIDALDIDLFKACCDGFFSMPPEAVASTQGRNFLRKNKDHLFETYREVIDSFADADKLYMEIRRVCNMASTIAEYREAWTGHCSAILERIKEHAASNKISKIRQVVVYIEQHYDRDISLEDAAEAVGLTASYLSSFFKKETGKNFLEYLTEYRIQVAKGLLKESTLSVG